MTQADHAAGPQSAFGVLRLRSFRLLWYNTLGFVLVTTHFELTTTRAIAGFVT